MGRTSTRKGVPTTPLSAQIDVFLEHCIARNLSLATLDAYRQMLGRFALFLSEHHPEVTSARDLRPQHILNFRLWLRRVTARAGAEASLSTQAKYVAAIRALLRYLAAEEGLDVIPTEAVQFPRGGKSSKSRRDARVLTNADVAHLLAQPDTRKIWGLRDRAIIALLADTGLRVSELCALDRRDIREDMLGRHRHLIVRPKQRYTAFAIGPDCQEYLRQYLAARSDRYIPLFVRHKPGKPREADDTQHRLTRQMVDRMLAHYARQAGLPILPSARDFTLRHQPLAS